MKVRSMRETCINTKRRSMRETLQGYLARKQTPAPGTLLQAHA